MATKPQSDAMRPKLSQYLQAAVPTDDPLYLPMNLQATSLDSAQLTRRYFRFNGRCKGCQSQSKKGSVSRRKMEPLG